ncbi:MAG: 3,4-dihydroxy-2-butanone-4-phosphate synthase [Candidatus Micrarchaeota archaeon]
MENKSEPLPFILDALRQGTPLVLLDDPGREGEADIILHAGFCTPKNVGLLRSRAGGLVCLGTDMATSKILQIPFAADLLRESSSPTLRALALSRAPYGDPSAFSVWINHKSTFTGITDGDRSKTILAFEKMVRESVPAPGKAKKSTIEPGSYPGEDLCARFVQEFYSPGHVPLLIARELSVRQGHTDFALALAGRAGLSPAVVMCEMLGTDSRALQWAEARRVAQENGWPAIDGKTLLGLLGVKTRKNGPAGRPNEGVC